MKTTDFTPGKIVYSVDVYKKFKLGDHKGYFDNYMAALFESEHDVIVNEIIDFQDHTQITMCYIEQNGKITIQEIYYFI